MTDRGPMRLITSSSFGDNLGFEFEEENARQLRSQTCPRLATWYSGFLAARLPLQPVHRKCAGELPAVGLFGSEGAGEGSAVGGDCSLGLAAEAAAGVGEREPVTLADRALER